MVIWKENDVIIFKVNYLESKVQLEEVAFYDKGDPWWEYPVIRNATKFEASIVASFNSTKGAPITDFNGAIGAYLMGRVFVTADRVEYFVVQNNVFNSPTHKCSNFGVFKKNTNNDEFDDDPWERVLPLEIIRK